MQKTITEREALVILLDMLSMRNWEDETTLEVIFSDCSWITLMQILNDNPEITEDEFLELIEEM